MTEAAHGPRNGKAGDGASEGSVSHLDVTPAFCMDGDFERGQCLL
jgi:hypothetical protein